MNICLISRGWDVLERRKVFSGAVPRIRRVRNVPLALRKAIKLALEALEQQGAVSKIEEPSDWVHLIVITKKR